MQGPYLARDGPARDSRVTVETPRQRGDGISVRGTGTGEPQASFSGKISSEPKSSLHDEMSFFPEFYGYRLELIESKMSDIKPSLYF